MLTATSHLAGSASPALPQSDPTPRQPRRRAGIAALWIVLVLPLLVLLIFFAVNIGNQWNARVELENSLEAAALAAVKEWAEGDGDSTLPARLVGQQYAAANYIGNCPVHIGLNHDPDTGGVNENDECCLPDGNLIFGSAIPIDPDDPDGPLKFDAGVRPSCGVGKVLFDASAQGGGSGNPLSDDNWWGVSFFRTEDTPDNLRIKYITFDLRGGGDENGSFVGDPGLSNNVTPHKMRVGGGPNATEQPDIVGLDDSPFNPGTQSNSQIEWEYSATDGAGKPYRLTFTFSDEGPDPGFDPCDRFRFGVSLKDVGFVGDPGNRQDDGDAVGAVGVRVEVIFELGDQELDPVYATFVDTDSKDKPGNTWKCLKDPIFEFCDDVSMMTVHPEGIPNLPCPPANGNDNDGQSYVMLQGSGSNKFAVRAHAKVPVPNLMSNFCGIGCGPSYVTACTTAIYDCSEGRPRLVRIDKFICPGPEETPDP